jgi:hypothetical protein
MGQAGAEMSGEHRTQGDYSARQTEAARRVLVELSALLAPFKDCLVLVGGWVPDLMPMEAGEDHVGSIDVDLALEAERLGAERYAALIQTLTETNRYKRAPDEEFTLYTMMNLGDGGLSVRVNVDFLKPAGSDLGVASPKPTVEVNPLAVDGCELVFDHPALLVIPGQKPGQGLAGGFRVASVAGFLVMKAHAMLGREKPKDAYDICYCLQHDPGGMEKLAAAWRAKREGLPVKDAILILGEKFMATDAAGPRQVVEFYNSNHPEERAMQARRAHELVQRFLKMVAFE